MLHGNRNVFHNRPDDPQVHRANLQPSFAGLYRLTRDASVESGPSAASIEAYLTQEKVRLEMLTLPLTLLIGCSQCHTLFTSTQEHVGYCDKVAHHLIVNIQQKKSV